MDMIKNIRPYADQIRKAYKAGKRTIEIDGVLLNITKQSKQVTFNSGGVTHQRVEDWLIAKPADGSLTPVFSVEAQYGKNQRS